MLENDELFGIYSGTRGQFTHSLVIGTGVVSILMNLYRRHNIHAKHTQAQQQHNALKPRKYLRHINYANAKHLRKTP